MSSERTRPDSRRDSNLPQSVRSLLNDASGAIAALYALVIFVLVAMAGVAWDYTRMTALDTELQNAADQAALAAATQLDGQEDAIDRATQAASNLVNNISVMANDGDGVDLVVQSLVFYKGYDQAEDSFDAVTTDDADARVVTVTIAPRQAFFVMTPVIALTRPGSGDIIAEASAALGSAICNTPPVMICNPREDDGEDFDASDFIGHGMRLISDDSGAPGNFGFLANGLGTGTSNLAASLGHDSQPGNCVAATGVTTEPGLKDVVFNAINTRFDLDINGENTCPDGAENCSAAAVVRKDLVKDTTDNKKCGNNGNGSWQQAAVGARYLPYLDDGLTEDERRLSVADRANVRVMGLPRDLCHAWDEDGDCSSAATDQYGIIGSGNWDRAAYFAANFPTVDWEDTAGLGSDVTRYEAYLWEAARALSAAETYQSDGSRTATAVPICRASGDLSRRLITAAIINCDDEGVAGRKENVEVDEWVELFLVEPSIERRVAGPSSDKLTDANDVYVEIVRTVDVGGDGEEGKVVRRDIPYLIR